MPAAATKPETDLTPNRLLVGVITLICFAAAAGMWSLGYSKQQTLAFAGFIRVGIFMAAFWFALPSKSRFAAWKGLSPWVIVCIAVAVFAIPRLKFSIPIVIGMLVLGAFIKPKKKREKKTIQTTTTPKDQT
jgi:glucan phosphoethanolaminetransferase (alkaline phosphatase superfamily)